MIRFLEKCIIKTIIPYSLLFVKREILSLFHCPMGCMVIMALWIPFLEGGSLVILEKILLSFLYKVERHGYFDFFFQKDLDKEKKTPYNVYYDT